MDRGNSVRCTELNYSIRALCSNQDVESLAPLPRDRHVGGLGRVCPLLRGGGFPRESRPPPAGSFIIFGRRSEQAVKNLSDGPAWTLQCDRGL
jgi:hypothetical protein